MTHIVKIPTPIDPRIPIKLPEPLKADKSDYSTDERPRHLYIGQLTFKYARDTSDHPMRAHDYLYLKAAILEQTLPVIAPAHAELEDVKDVYGIVVYSLSAKDNTNVDLPAIFHTRQLSVTMSVEYSWHIVDKQQSYLKTTGKPEILFIRDTQGRPQSKDAPEYAELIEALVHRTETHITEAIPVYIHEPINR